jgi:signal transduction histidine kinase
VAIPPDIRTTLARILGAGLAAVVLAGGAVWGFERARFGDSSEASMARVEAEVRQRFDRSAATLRDLTSRVVADRDLIPGASRDTETAQRLFAAVESALPREIRASTGITVYDASGAPLAWAGRVVDLLRSQLDTGPPLFVAPDALGPRLVRVQPIVDRTRPTSQRLGTVVAEQLLGDVRGVPDLVDTFVLSGDLAPVSLRAPVEVRSDASPYSFVVSSSDGEPLVEAWIAPADLALARSRWRSVGGAVILSIVGLTLIVSVAPLVELRRRARGRATFAWATLALLGIIVSVRIVTWFAAGLLLTDPSLAKSVELLANALMLTALVWLTLDLAERRRLARPRPPLLVAGSFATIWTLLPYFTAGVVDAAALWTYERFLQGLVSRTGFDLIHFSLHPLSASRMAISFGLVLLHAGLIWTGALVLRLADLAWRRSRRPALRAAAVGSWTAGVVAAAGAASRIWGPVPLAPLAIALAATAACAVALSRPRGPVRRASQVARLLLLYLALVVPAFAMYPSLEAFATTAKEQIVANVFAPQAINQREDLQRQRDRTLEQIDAMPYLSSLVEGKTDAESAAMDQAYSVWSQTALGANRITSSVELYGADGRLVSRFALNLPEYTLTPHSARSCEWVFFEEVSSFAPSERYVLRATRGICTREGPVVGSIVVRMMLDYRTLPFISSQRPYLESLRSDDQGPAEGAPGRDVEFAIYGWSRAPIYTFWSGVWPLPDAVFDRLVSSRTRFWASITRDDGRTYRVYFLNDRGGIYALGYPVMTWFGRLVNLTELMSLTLMLCALLVGGATIFNALTSPTPASGRALLREVRSSFYLKLWLAFVAVAVVPVVILALLTRAYFAGRFRAGVEQDAVKTATVAQRLVEDYATLEQHGTGQLEALDDQALILVSQAIDQDVNLFDPKRLHATSQPDLFASRVLPLRTPGDVYRTLVLDRLPTFVGEEEVGRSPYLLAAARVRAGQREGIVTVPLTLQGRELDEQIDDLDRQLLFGSWLFVLLGASLGYWMAERIADPVSRLTRATRRIARGDLDARIAATSSDELRRLVEDFNHMAADLKRQRSKLERTQRLEAWADMARQVAHDIKNPLTPIQLSAEHARRVNNDRGRPLSPVLDECVNAILTQVRLLRQISAEFSSFASSPTPRPEPTDLPALIEEVLNSYRPGLAGRIEIAVQAAADLPAVWIDRTLFARTLTNLIENALYAMPGGGTLTITSRQPAGDGQPTAGRPVVVTVSDTGAGMDQEALGRIFEPYFSTKASGTGLGLTIARRNVELNGGTIAVQSRRGAGTTVTITLPALP